MRIFFIGFYCLLLLSFSLLQEVQALSGYAFAYGPGHWIFKAAESGTKDSLEREVWINEAIAVLKARGPGDYSIHLKQRVVEGEGYRQISYSLRNQEGCIAFPNGDWLCLLVHSGHNNETIGDITLAIDHRGRLYMNEGHVCGGIISFYTDKAVGIDSVADFIRFCQSDTDEKAWTTFE